VIRLTCNDRNRLPVGPTMATMTRCVPLLALALIAACKVYDPLYCDEDRPCIDPDRPFCDLEGAYPASEGVGKTCIPDPSGEGADSDAGSSADGGAGPSDGGDASPARAVKDLVTTNLTSCATLTDGALRCWGELYTGRAPVGDDEPPSEAGDIPTGGAIAQVALGHNFICVLYQAGNVRCWGDNAFGQLGYGHVEDIARNPDELADVSLGGPARQIALGNTSACALLESGDVRCWGSNTSGQLGYGHTRNIGDDELPSAQDPVDLGGAVARLAAGAFHFCAVLTSGSLRCWGTNAVGQLGYGHSENIGDDESPAGAGNVNIGGEVIDAAPGELHTCALLQEGAIRCWGAASAALGLPGIDEDVGDDEAPASVDAVDVGGAARQIVVGSSSSCALLVNGEVRCWGSNTNGQNGQGTAETIGDNETPGQAGNVPLGGAVEELSTGCTIRRRHHCALLGSGAVRCWGYNFAGQLGYGDRENMGDDETPETAGDVMVLD
jgi:alpha-tubulin suppressor-like RCC1 family protein